MSQNDANDLARRLMVAAAQFAGGALERYGAEYPEQLEQLARSGAKFAVRVDDLLAASSRAAVVAVLVRDDEDGVLLSREVEVVHVEVSKLGEPGGTSH